MQAAKKDRTCQARQYSDQMICGACGLQWDVNDTEPPECPKTGTEARGSGAPLDIPPPQRKGLPAELPEDVAAEMFQTLQYARATGADGVEAMRRAYRLLLDRVDP